MALVIRKVTLPFNYQQARISILFGERMPHLSSQSENGKIGHRFFVSTGANGMFIMHINYCNIDKQYKSEQSI